MGEHKLTKPPLQSNHERHMRDSRLPSARHYETAPPDCVESGTRMWAARYADDVEALLAEVDRLRALLRTQPASPQSDPAAKEKP